MRILKNFVRDLRRHWILCLMLLPVLAYYVIFHYGPMYGVQIAFKDYSAGRGIMGSPWIGLSHFTDFFKGVFFWRLIRNTLMISFGMLIFGFPMPIFFALMLNEIKQMSYKRVVQTLSYLPHFISMVVMCGIIVDFTKTAGLFNDIFVFFGGERKTLLLFPEYFRPVYIISGIWQEMGWNSIIYLAAISGVNPELYEAATVDGAGRFRKIINVTIPSIAPTIIILLILRVGNLMSVGFEKVLLLQNPSNLITSDIISTYVYKRGLLDGNFSFSSAVGLFNSVINFMLIMFANQVSKKVSETSLW